MNILSFDTSEAHVTAALSPSGNAIYEKMARGQAERLIPMCEQLLGDHDATWSDLDAIGVGVGPGNFTGIRIAVSAARGLAMALDIPAIGITGFELLASAGNGQSLVALPAPRDQAYVQAFDGERPLGTAQTLLPGHRDFHADGPIRLVIGYRAKEIAQAYGVDYNEDVWNLRQPGQMASQIAHRASAKLAMAAGTWADPPTPLYVRSADAAPPRDAPPVIR